MPTATGKRKTTTTRTPGGQVVIEEEEGRVETRVSPIMDVSTVGDFTSLWDTNVGDFSEGQVIVSALISGHASAEWTAIEMRVIGYLGPAPTIMWAGFLGGSHVNARVPLRQGDSFDKIGFEGRIVVNGSPGPGSTPPAVAQASAIVKLWG